MTCFCHVNIYILLPFCLCTNQNLWIVKYSIDAAGFLILDTQSFILKRQANCKVISILLDRHSSVDDVALRLRGHNFAHALS